MCEKRRRAGEKERERKEETSEIQQHYTLITRAVAFSLLWFTFEKNDNGQKVAVFP